MHTTSRLVLAIPDGTEAVSGYPAEAAQAMGVLDAAVIYQSGSIAGRAGLTPVAGTLYYATDLGQWAVYSGSVWQPLNLRFRANVSGSATLTAGDCVTAAPSAALTLPVASASLAPVEIAANGSVTATSPVTVNGSSIFGAGLSAASTFTLGAPLATVVLVPVGSTWVMISGAQDTGWVALTTPAGTTPAGAYVPAARLTGTRVELRGQMDVTSLSFGDVVGVTGAGMRPSSVVTVSSMFGPLRMPNGNNNIDYFGSSPYTGTLSLDGVFYPVS